MSPVDDREGTMDVWGFLSRRKSFIILLSLVGMGLAYLWYEQEPMIYRTSAQLQVIYRGGNMGLYGLLMERNDLEDAQYVVKSPMILQAAFEKHELRNLQLLAGLSKEEAANRIGRMLRTQELSANVLEITCEAQRPDEVATIANAVAEEFVKHHQEKYSDSRAELEALLAKARTELHEDLKRLEDDYKDFRDKSALMSDGSNPYRERQAQYESKINQLAIRQTELKADIDSLHEAIARGESREAILMMISRRAEGVDTRQDKDKPALDAEYSARSLMQHLFPLFTEEAMLASQVGEDHPRLVEVRSRIEFTRKHYQEMAGMIPEVTGPDQQVDVVQVYLDALTQELAGLRVTRDQLVAEAKVEGDKARQLMQEEFENANRQNEISRLSSLFDSISTQIKETEFNAEIGGVEAGILSPARHGELVYPIVAQFLGIGGIAGAFAGLLLGYLVELADRRFRKPEDIIREFGVPIVGHIPFLKEERLRSGASHPGMDATAVTLHQPRSRPAESFRSVRTALCFSALGSGHRVIQVTSPAAGDGKSTLALNLAISLAISGKRTLLMESDFRRPRVHKLTGVSNELGAVNVLRGEAELDDVIQPSVVPELFVLPCGKRPKNPAELLSRPEYEQLIAVLREKFDYVIIDTPPVLAVSDPCGVAPRVDGVLVCFRLSKHNRDQGRNALELLRDVGARIAGLVVNGVTEDDGYGYRSYRYSDYRQYYGGYNAYSYDEDQAMDERDDAHAETRPNVHLSAVAQKPVR